MSLSSVFPVRSIFVILLSLVLSTASFALAQEGQGESSSKQQQQQTPVEKRVPRGSQKITLETSESLFDFMAVLNACGYERELEISNPVRARIREDFAAQVNASEPAQQNLRRACEFYKDHELADFGRNLAQYVSLALNLKPAPMFVPALPEADLPPDAARVLGFLPLVDRLYESANLAALWQKYQPAYESLVEAQHDAVSHSIQDIDLYLKLPIGGYVGQRFVVTLEPQIAPRAVNARNYGADYFLVVSPTEDGRIDMHALRHTYLHYVVDPILLNYGTTLHGLDPLLKSVSESPMDDSYKSDMILLTTESLIRAIEARTAVIHVAEPDRKAAARAVEDEREKIVDAAVAQGFVLTRYFYNALEEFEKDPAGFKTSVSDMLHKIDLERERKAAKNIEFSRQADPELVGRAQKELKALDLAEQRLWSGDIAGARQLAQKALDTKHGDQAEALYVLARADLMSGDAQQAVIDFQRTLQIATDTGMIAWSHIYLGRILDLQGEREAALVHYNAALSAGDSNAATRTAAEQGIAKPYESRRPQQ